MPLYMCSECGSVDNTALGGYWRQEMEAGFDRNKFKPLCSACYPQIGKWHDEFPRRSAEGFVQDKAGKLYKPEEAEGYFKHMGPFVPVVLPAPHQ